MNGVIFYVAAAAIGVLAAVSDWRNRRIPNSIVLAGLATFAGGVALRLVGSILGYRGIRIVGLSEYYMPWAYFSRLAEHAALSGVASLTLWGLDVWPAGDAKLFIVLSWLMPLANPNLSGFPLLLSLFFLINCFVPAGVLFALEASAAILARGRGTVIAALSEPREAAKAVRAAFHRAYKRLLDYWPRRWRATALLVNLGALFLVFRLLESHMRGGALVQACVMLAMFALWPRLAALLSRPWLSVAGLLLSLVAAAAAAARGIDLRSQALETARSLIDFGLLVTVARKILAHALDRAAVERVVPERIAAGTILADESRLELSSDARGALIVSQARGDGLSVQDAADLSALLRERGAADVAVMRAHPFAAWIVLGAAVTLWRPGNVVVWAIAWGRGLSVAAAGVRP